MEADCGANGTKATRHVQLASWRETSFIDPMNLSTRADKRMNLRLVVKTEQEGTRERRGESKGFGAWGCGRRRSERAEPAKLPAKY